MPIRARVLVGLVCVAAGAAPAAADADPVAALLQRLDAVAQEVSRVRGLPLKQPIPLEVVGKDEVRARLLKLAAEEKTAAESAAEAFALERWGMLPPGTDYNALLIDLLTEQIAGYYDPDTKKLTISRAAADDLAWAEMVLTHEIEHGLQDQAFDLKKFDDLPVTEGDALAARRALVEGDGIALMIEVMLGRTQSKVNWANPLIAAAIEKSMSATGGGSEAGGAGNDGLDRAPVAIREALMFPYRTGFAFVAALRRRQPWSAVDAAFAKPPQSTEQIIHPERYLAGDTPIAIASSVPPALAGYAIAHSDVWGELGFSLWLRSHGVYEDIAGLAAAGWGGDRVIVVARPGEKTPARGIGIARTEWDSEIDAIEAMEAAGKALSKAVVGATLEQSATRLQLFGIDGTVSWLERRGSSLVIVIGAPLRLADALLSEVWSATKITGP